MSTFLALQRTQLYSGLAATLDAYSRLLELRHRCCINGDYRDAYDATKNWINRSFKVAQIATELFLKCNSYITRCSTWTKLSMQVYVNTTCNIVRRSAKRCRQVLFEFWFWRGDSLLLQNNTGIGGTPQTKLTINEAEILSIHRKWTSTCKSRDSGKAFIHDFPVHITFMFIFSWGTPNKKRLSTNLKWEVTCVESKMLRFLLKSKRFWMQN